MKNPNESSHYEVEMFVPGENGPKRVTGKVFTDGEAPDVYVLVRFLTDNSIFKDRDDAIDWMRKYKESSKITWVPEES